MVSASVGVETVQIRGVWAQLEGAQRLLLARDDGHTIQQILLDDAFLAAG
jgi:hypothetical protein